MSVGFSIISKNNQTEVIRAESGMSLRSWGENITIHIKPISSNAVEISIESEPKAQLDWSRSHENIIKIIRIVEKYLK